MVGMEMEATDKRLSLYCYKAPSTYPTGRLVVVKRTKVRTRESIRTQPGIGCGPGTRTIIIILRSSMAMLISISKFVAQPNF